MSMRALLIAVRNKLHIALGVDGSICSVRPGPEPPPSAGELFIAIHGTGWTSNEYNKSERGIGEIFRVSCTITRRCTYAPSDRWDDEPFLALYESLESTARLIIQNVHQSSAVFLAANSLISGSDKFLTPLFWIGGDPSPKEVYADWFGGIAEPTDFGNLSGVAGLSLEVTFGEAVRLQTLANLT